MKNRSFIQNLLSLSVLLFPLFLHGQQLVSDLNKSVTGSSPTFLRAGTNKIVFTAIVKRMVTKCGNRMAQRLGLNCL